MVGRDAAFISSASSSYGATHARTVAPGSELPVHVNAELGCDVSGHRGRRTYGNVGPSSFSGVGPSLRTVRQVSPCGGTDRPAWDVRCLSHLPVARSGTSMSWQGEHGPRTRQARPWWRNQGRVPRWRATPFLGTAKAWWLDPVETSGLLGLPEDLGDLVDLGEQLVGHLGVHGALVPVAPASLVASLTRVCSCGYFSKCGGLK